MSVDITPILGNEPVGIVGKHVLFIDGSSSRKCEGTIVVNLLVSVRVCMGKTVFALVKRENRG